jgi:hypothetical protein
VTTVTRSVISSSVIVHSASGSWGEHVPGVAPPANRSSRRAPTACPRVARSSSLPHLEGRHDHAFRQLAPLPVAVSEQEPQLLQHHVDLLESQHRPAGKRAAVVASRNAKRIAAAPTRWPRTGTPPAAPGWQAARAHPAAAYLSPPSGERVFVTESVDKLNLGGVGVRKVVAGWCS